MKHVLSESDRERVRAAVAAAEGRTAGEIVPYIVPRSDPYEVARWRAAVLFAVVALGLVMLVFQFYDGWGLGWLHTGWGTALVLLVAGTLGAVLAAFAAPFGRLMAGSDHMARAVHRRALQAFVDEEVFLTRDRTGILLFVSLFEHRIEVVGDAGINARVEPEEWVDVVARLRTGIKNGRLADGLADAVERCGRLLERQGVEIRPDDVNELSDDVRFQEDS